MQKRLLSGLTLCLLLISLSSSAFNTPPAKSEPKTITVPDNYATIQAAINNANSGDTIYVRAGTYNENLAVNKKLSIVGEDPETTRVYGGSKGSGILIRANSVLVTGFTFQNDYGAYYVVYLDRCRNNTIRGNIVQGGFTAIFACGSENNTITGNTCFAVWDYGVLLENSNNNVISKNLVTQTWYGIGFWNSNNNLAYNNTARNSLAWQSPTGFEPAGLLLWDRSKNNKIVGNSFTSDFWNGISVVWLCTGNLIMDNDVRSNGGAGIWIGQNSTKNTIYRNSFDNQNEFYAEDQPNTWDLAQKGNYWSDYSGTDLYSGRFQNETGSDGLGDMPYVINGENTDHYPLMHSWSPLPVHNMNTGLGYSGIQEAIDATGTLDGHKIFVENGTYRENAVASKSLSVQGEYKVTTIVDGGITITADYVGLSDLTIRNAECAIGIYSFNVTVANNIIKLSNHAINASTSHSMIAYNLISSNQQGIQLNANSTHNNVIGNSIHNNTIGISVAEGSTGNTVYHNNIINNSIQAQADSTNTWDDGYPSGGNYWSDHNGTDFYSGQFQNETGSDGIKDNAYSINADNHDHYPLIAPPNIAILELTTSKSVVGLGSTLSVNTTVRNEGYKAETFNVTVYANSSVIASRILTLARGESVSIMFLLNTAGWSRGRYLIAAYAHPVPSEFDVDDNARMCGPVTVTIPGDVNGDSAVDILDVVMITSGYMLKTGNPRFEPDCDIDDDGNIDIFDLVICTSHYGNR
jgi:parallel beta-helix repeat protein